jgi:hypothetical protein
MRWAELAVLTWAAGCSAAAAELPDRAPDPPAAQTASATPATRSVAPRRHAAVPAATTDLAPGAEEEAPAPAPPSSKQPDPTGTWVTGLVESADGAPLAKAFVIAFLGSEHTSGETDESGRFAIRVSSPTGSVLCFAWKVDHALVVGPWTALREGERVNAGTLRCGVAAPIEGRIVGLDGEGVHGHVDFVSSSAYDAETWAILRYCTDLVGEESYERPTGSHAAGFWERSMPRGRYVLRAVGGGAPVTVDAPAQDVAVPDSPCEPWSFTARVRILEWDGAPAEDCALEAVPTDEQDRISVSYAREADVTAITVGSDDTSRADVVATSADGRSACRRVSSCDTDVVELRLPRWRESELRSIRGTVTFAGRPVTYAAEALGTRVRVSARPVGGDPAAGRADDTTTNSDGTFEIDGLGPGEYELWASPCEVWGNAPELAAARAAATSGGDDVTIEMPPSLARTFRVVVPDGFGPIDDWDVRLASPDGDDDVPEWEHDEDERFVVTRMRADVAYSMTARVHGGGGWTRPIRVGALTAGRETLALRADHGLLIAGRATRADGTPVVAASVWLERDGDDFSHETYSGLDGEFAIGGLEPGAWTLKASAPGLGFRGDGVRVAAGAEGLRVRLDPGTR